MIAAQQGLGARLLLEPIHLVIISAVCGIHREPYLTDVMYGMHVQQAVLQSWLNAGRMHRHS